MSFFDHFKPKPQPRQQDPGIAPFKIGEYVVAAPAVLDPIMVDHKPGRVIDVQYTDNPRDPLGPWLITIEWPSGWQAMFAAAELTRFNGTPDHVREEEPTPLYDQMKDEGTRAKITVTTENNVTAPDDLAEYADELASIGDRIEDDLRTLTRRNQRRAAARKGMRS